MVARSPYHGIRVAFHSRPNVHHVMVRQEDNARSRCLPRWVHVIAKCPKVESHYVSMVAPSIKIIGSNYIRRIWWKVGVKISIGIGDDIRDAIGIGGKMLGGPPSLILGIGMKLMLDRKSVV